MRPLFVLACASFIACAGSRPLPPGNELEVADDRRDGDSDLAQAFEVPAAVSEVGPSPFQEEETASGPSESDVATDVDAALEAAPSVPTAASLAERAFLDAGAAKDLRAQKESALAWLVACGPKGVGHCRAGALRALASLAAAKDLAAKVRDADACLLAFEKSARLGLSVPACKGAASAAFRSTHDRLMSARGALAEARTGEDPSRFERAGQVCGEPRCALVRRSAWILASYAWAKKDVLDNSALAALRAGRAEADMLGAGQQTYCFLPVAQAACARFDARSGPGACRKLEARTFPDACYRDYSKAKVSADAVKARVGEVGEHFGPSLLPCFEAQAKRLVAPAFEKYGVAWRLSHAGRVEQVHMQRKDLEDSPLAQCLKEKFALWRYPRYDGEHQHVEQVFTVTSR